MDSQYGYQSEDDCEDQGMAPTDHCLDWKCQTWEGSKPVRPLLALKGKFWCCPKCNASYGERSAERLALGPIEQK